MVNVYHLFVNEWVLGYRHGYRSFSNRPAITVGLCVGNA